MQMVTQTDDGELVDMILEAVQDAPNPQFVREGWSDLCGEWQFAYDDADEGLRDGWFERDHVLPGRITVPYPPESRRSGVADTGFHRVLWYRREVDVVAPPTNGRVLLRFGAVDYRATVWVNGRFVGAHEGGQTPFAIDITHALASSNARQVITVRVEDDPHDVEQPRGKQDWQESPHVIWYHRTSGIWQPVWLERVPGVWLTSVRWAFDPARWSLRLDAELSDAAPAGATLAAEIELADQPVTHATFAIRGRQVHGAIDLAPGRTIMDPASILWSPSQPNLLGIRLTLSAPGHQPDVVLTYYGLRHIEVTPRRIRINGTPVFLRLVLQQGYWPESQLAAPSAEALRKEAEVIRALGFDGARIHQKVEDPRFLYWADRLGLLLWGEMANAFVYSERAIQRHAGEWREAVKRDRNHPSIIAWVPFNESWGVNEVGLSKAQQHAVRAAYHMTHQLDGTRPVVGNDGWEHVESDLFTIHDYTWAPETLQQRYGSGADLAALVESFFPGSRRLVTDGFRYCDKPVLVTEFGGVSYAPASGEKWFGYGTVRTPGEYLEMYRQLTAVLNHSDLICGYCYTQLTDTEQETNGLLTADRAPKADIAELRRITRGEVS